MYPQGWKAPRPYLRIVPQPKSFNGCKTVGQGRPHKSRAALSITTSTSRDSDSARGASMGRALLLR